MLPLQPMLEHSARSRPPEETVLLQGVLGTMHVLDLPNHRTINSILDLVPITTVVHPMSLGGLRLDTRDRTLDSGQPWASKVGTKTLFVVTTIHPKCPADLVLLLVSLVGVRDRLQTSQVNLGCHLRKAKIRDSKGTAATWVIKCTVSKARNMVLDQVAWEDTTSTAARTTRLVATGVMGLAMAQVPTATVIGVDGVPPTTGTDELFHKKPGMHICGMPERCSLY